ncbi:MAG: PH domain-containing protein [Clostridiales Family XIII bacterium]|jgi:putative membrane protein|nr:PH domain-containing protein [Clostridiales Family XIII bacterium]
MQPRTDLNPDTIKHPVDSLAEKHRLHWAYIPISALRKLRKNIFSMAIPIIALSSTVPEGVLPGFMRRWMIVAGVILIFVIIFAIATLIQYRTTAWWITDREVVFSRGLLNRKNTRMPLDKIHAVNLRAKLMEQIFGVTNVSIDTAGGAKANDIVIPAVKTSYAEALRVEILTRARKVGTDIAPPAAAAADCVNAYRLAAKEILLAGLSNGRTLFYLIAGFSVFWQFFDTFGLRERIGELGQSWFARFMAMGLPSVIAIIVFVLFVAWCVSVIAYAVRYYGFSIRKDGGKIGIKQGLLDKNAIEFAPTRIQELHIKRDLIQRAFGYATIKVKLATGGILNEEGKLDLNATSGVVLHPFIKMKDVEGYIAAFIPSFAAHPEKTEGLPRAACRRSLFRYLRGACLIAAIPTAGLSIADKFTPRVAQFTDAFAPHIFVFTLLFFGFMLFTGLRAWKGRGIATTDEFIAIQNGAYKTETVYIPKRKIQVVSVWQNPFQRGANLSTVKIRTAAIGSALELRDCSAHTATDYLVWVRRDTSAERYCSGMG